jgi:hypothetical protein
VVSESERKRKLGADTKFSKLKANTLSIVSLQVNSTDLGWMLNVSKSVSDVDGKPLTAVGPMIAKIFSSIAVNVGAYSGPPL